MSSQLTLKGFLYPGNACPDSCNGSKGAVSPFELAFRNCAESYPQLRSGDFPIATAAGAWVELPIADQLGSIELLALKTSGPLLLRLDGLPASVTTAVLYPVAGLSGLALTFGVDGYPVAVTFAAGDDTADEVVRRINAAAALGAVPFTPARVIAAGQTGAGQIEIRGQKTGAQGALTAFAGSAAATLGLTTFVGATGTGSDVTIDGLQLWQFPHSAGVRLIEVSGSASVSVLAAGT